MCVGIYVYPPAIAYSISVVLPDAEAPVTIKGGKSQILSISAPARIVIIISRLPIPAKTIWWATRDSNP